MQESLQGFFRTLEGSLTSDWECEIHYELILQQLRILQGSESEERPKAMNGGKPMKKGLERSNFAWSSTHVHFYTGMRQSTTKSCIIDLCFIHRLLVKLIK